MVQQMSEVPSTPRELARLNAIWQLTSCKEFTHKFAAGRHTITVLLHSGKTLTRSGLDVDVVSSHLLVDAMESNREEADENDRYDNMLEHLVDYAQKKRHTLTFNAVNRKTSNPALSPRVIRESDAVLRIGKSEFKGTFNHWNEEKMKQELVGRAFAEILGVSKGSASSSSSTK